jgi:hypothetical protein
LRRNRKDDGEWLVLPAEVTDPAPPFPLPAPSVREAELWEDLWSRPQAFAWRRFGLEYDVAIHVRRAVVAGLPDASVASVTLWRQGTDALGLSVTGLRLNRWRLSPGTEAAATGPVAPVVSIADILAESRRDLAGS